MLAEDRLDGFERSADDGRMDESDDRSEALCLKLQSRRDSRRRVPGELCAEAVAFARAAHAFARSQWTVHGPAGTRIEALSMEQVFELFEALCCSG